MAFKDPDLKVCSGGRTVSSRVAVLRRQEDNIPGRCAQEARGYHPGSVCSGGKGLSSRVGVLRRQDDIIPSLCAWEGSARMPSPSLGRHRSPRLPGEIGGRVDVVRRRGPYYGRSQARDEV